jgi:hypothetical protein
MSPKTAGADSIQVHADTTSFKRLFDKSSQVEPKLKTALRKRTRVAAEQLADTSRLEVMNHPGGTVSAKPHHTGLRMAIASGITVKVMTGARAGVTIVASSAQMPAGKESLVRAWEIGNGTAKGWRHPVFDRDSQLTPGGKHGEGQVWVTQKGHPYFARPIYTGRDVVTKAVEAAMVEAAESLK